MKLKRKPSTGFSQENLQEMESLAHIAIIAGIA